MTEYCAPLADMQFLLRERIDLEAIARLPGYEDVSLDLAQSVLEQSGRFASEVLSPLNRTGDVEGSRWQQGQVLTPNGFRQAYTRFIADGWNAMACPSQWGGQNQPRVLAALVEEMWHGANTAFALCPMLTRSAMDAIAHSGSPRLQYTYLPKLVSGEWTGTMNLTEPQAGSDLAAIRTRAVPAADGSYRLEGQKIFITYGEHDLSDNIIHLVLARTPDAPEGVKGISLFVVPKVRVGDDGLVGARNDVHCVSIEHKLGIHASPTCVMAFGQNGGAVGELVGEENRGLEYMFVMMNAARFAVGVQGIGIAERAYQRALAFARERIQGAEPGTRRRERVAIIRHPDVRRMLLLMKSQTEAMRALSIAVAAAVDLASGHADASERARHQAFAELMTPVTKGWCTETAVKIASLGIQIHGGMGFVEETGAAQHLRDARITPIYEGTTGIQANDLIGRKFARDGGHAVALVLEQMRTLARALAESSELRGAATVFSTAVEALASAIRYAIIHYANDIRAASAGAVPLLRLFGIVAGGAELLHSASLARKRLDATNPGAAETAFYVAKIATARFYVDHVLSQAQGLAHVVTAGAAAALDEGVF